MRRARPLAAATAVALAIALAGCAQLENLGNSVQDLVKNLQSPAPPPSDTQDTEFVLGDCFDMSALDENGPKRPPTRGDCSLAHDFEVFDAVELPDIGYPGAHKLYAVALQECRERLTGFAGAPLRYSTLDYNYIAPSDADWARGDHDLECVTFRKDHGPLTGTAEFRDQDVPVPDSSPTPPPTSEDPYDELYTELAVGECYDGSAGSAASRVVIQTCAKPHFAEVYAVPTLGFASYPGEDQAEERANDLCFGAFADYVGAEYEDSWLGVGYSTPTKADWAGKDTRVVCIAVRYAFGPLLEGSVKDTGILG